MYKFDAEAISLLWEYLSRSRVLLNGGLVQDIQCARFSKDASLLGIAGNDKIVRLFKPDRSNSHTTLTGHFCAVSTLSFSFDEATVASGSVSGVVKVWDACAGSLMCSLFGHLDRVTCLANSSTCLPQWATGSVNDEVKLWDTRCPSVDLLTIKGKYGSARCLEFSPHGQWLVCGFENRAVMIWDLRSSSSLALFDQHSGPINEFDFHPNEMLLASSSEDKTVRFWDLESLECVTQSDCDGSAVKNVTFHKDGQCLYSASASGLRVLGWEPFVIYDQIDNRRCSTIDWRFVCQTQFSQSRNQLLVLCLDSDACRLSISTLNSHLLAPFAVIREPDDDDALSLSPKCESDESDHSVVDVGNDIGTVGLQKLSKSRIPKAQLTRAVTLQDISTSNTTTVADDLSAFRPTRCLQRSPPCSPNNFASTSRTCSLERVSKLNRNTSMRQLKGEVEISSQAVKGSLAPLNTLKSRSLERKATSRTLSHANSTASSSSCCSLSSVASKSTTNVHSASTDAGYPLKYTGARPLRTTTNTTGSVSSIRSPGVVEKSPSSASSLSSSRLAARRRTTGAVATVTPLDTAPVARGVTKQTAASRKKLVNQVNPLVHTCSNESLNLSSCKVEQLSPSNVTTGKLDPKLPRQRKISNEFKVFPSCSATTEQAALQLIEKSAMVVSLLNYRRNALSMILSMTKSRGLKEALQEMIHIQDDSILVDVLNILNANSSLWSLDVCCIVLPRIGELLKSKYENYVQTALDSLLLMLNGFGPMFKQYASTDSTIGVDIAQEERIEKCKKCSSYLLAIRNVVIDKNKLSTADINENRLWRDFKQSGELLNSFCND
ncbi:Katanin p80 WD40 repeat-containing subunit B1 [Trichinella murrelli]|uniref:Katanin p80 WD40 repeat-containing subunit B1 n=1 Tax=Trichinella murrelli TaxID=144512 RepID=A0A0V0TAE5_9BILA|nr:Katanin p80 WD40 repeat-containing subunit B1 [Trichinella murrelli]